MNFLEKNKRFSFLYNKKNAWDSEYSAQISVNGNTVTAIYDFEGGLRITNIAKKYEKFGAYEWINYLENVSDAPTGVISELWDCDCELPLEHEEERKITAVHPETQNATRIFAPYGSMWTETDFYSDVDLYKGEYRPNYIEVGLNNTKKYSTSGGRSSEAHAPFFNISKNNSGYIAAIGWSGQWHSEMIREKDYITLKTGIEKTNFKLMPGEKFRTSSIVVMPYSNGLTDSHNTWRRLVKEQYSLIGKNGRPKEVPFSYMVWGGTKTDMVLDRIKCIKNTGLPAEYIWMDAGWYGADTKPSKNEFEGDWGVHTGDWEVSRFIHRNDLKDVADAVHNTGKKFLLWFEPERVAKASDFYKKHPQHLLTCKEDTGNALLNIGEQKTWDYCCNMLKEHISRLKLDCIRIDFNFSPLPFWRENDKQNRNGITEIKYINGLYRLWDTLLDEFPSLIIDNCASGGRRIDIETLKRSVPLWRSDLVCPANYSIKGVQNHSLSYNLWMPYSGSGGGRSYDEYRIRSSYAPGLGLTHFYSENEEKFYKDKENIEFLKKYSEEYLKVRPYLTEDFYPLSEVSVNNDVWCAAQYDRPKENDGLIIACRRENSPYEKACYKLGGIENNKEYIFCDADGKEFAVNGKELVEKGLELVIPEKRKVKIYFYRKR